VPNLSTSAKAVDAATADPGDVLFYTITLSNTGDAAATGAMMTDTLPANVTYSAGPVCSAGACGYAGGVITWTGTVSVGLPVTVSYQVMVNLGLVAGMQITNTAIVADGLTAPFETNVVTTTVSQVAGVALEPNRSTTADPGTVVTYTHTLTNTGNGPDIFDFTHASSQGWEVAYETPIVLGAWQTTTVVVSVTVPSGVISGTVDSTVITATSRASPGVFDTVTDTTRVTVSEWVVYLPVVLRNYSP
jgi:uncharacterized repeat protein (TIGR01451 family)